VGTYRATPCIVHIFNCVLRSFVQCQQPLNCWNGLKHGRKAQRLDVSLTKSPHSSHCLLVIEKCSVTESKLKSRRVKPPRRLREAGRSRSRSFPLAILAPSQIWDGRICGWKSHSLARSCTCNPSKLHFVTSSI
jgi:hypothetical protein